MELTQRQQMLQLEHNQKIQGIDVELTKLIADIAQKEHFDYVFAKGIVVFGAEDLTQKVANAMKK